MTRVYVKLLEINPALLLKASENFDAKPMDQAVTKST
jgi:hypothetical protein